MRWVPVEGIEAQCSDVIGSREGHCAALIKPTSLLHPSPHTEEACYALVVGGYKEGELCPYAAVCRLGGEEHPSDLNGRMGPWRKVPHRLIGGKDTTNPLECDGATLSSFVQEEREAMEDEKGDHAVYLFGGLTSDYERSNTVYELRLVLREEWSEGEADGEESEDDEAHECPFLLLVKVLDPFNDDKEEGGSPTAEVPAPRARHSAGVYSPVRIGEDNGEGRKGKGQRYLYIFGGETDENSETNDFYRFNIQTRRWENLLDRNAVNPPPRLLSSSLIRLCLQDHTTSEKEKREYFVLYGGAFFDEKGDLKSRSDLFEYSLSEGVWRPIEAEAKRTVAEPSGVEEGHRFPPCNGHDGYCYHTQNQATIYFVGGKEHYKGENRIKVLSIKTSINDNNNHHNHPSLGGLHYETELVSPEVSGEFDGDWNREREEEEYYSLCFPYWRYTPLLLSLYPLHWMKTVIIDCC